MRGKRALMVTSIMPIHCYVIEIKYIVDESNHGCKLGSSTLKSVSFFSIGNERDGQTKYLKST